MDDTAIFRPFTDPKSSSFTVLLTSTSPARKQDTMANRITPTISRTELHSKVLGEANVK